jgi:hypothetical protein
MPRAARQDRLRQGLAASLRHHDRVRPACLLSGMMVDPAPSIATLLKSAGDMPLDVKACGRIADGSTAAAMSGTTRAYCAMPAKCQ